MKRVKWTNNALKNLNREVEYIAQDNQEAARKMATLIRKTVNLLETMPLMGRQGEQANTRELIIQNLPYIVIYRVQDDTIYIARILHTSRERKH